MREVVQKARALMPLVDVGYILMKLYASVRYRSFWFLSLAVYYALLLMMKVFLRRGVSPGRDVLLVELKRARLCGVLLICLAQVLALMVFFMVYWERSFAYPGVLIYAQATYAFYTITMAVVMLLKERRTGSPTQLAQRVVGLTAALISILALETAMLTTFGGQDDPLFRPLMVGLSGACIYGLVMVMAIRMYRWAQQKIRP